MSVDAAELLAGGRGALEFLDIGGEIAARSPLQLFWARFRQDRVALVSLSYHRAADPARDLRRRWS